jgi:riboflavin synthase
MFSGLIGYRGRVTAREQLEGGGMTLVVACEGADIERPEIKDSIAVNGVCLTATAIDGDLVRFDVIPETLVRSNLGALDDGELVNVEYSLRIGDRMGGHFVYGHIDASLRVLARTPEGQGERVRIQRPDSLAPMIVDKAFIAIDGVSLTVAGVGYDWFELALIPETLARTTLGERTTGTLVNVEVDPMARYAASVILSLSKDTPR